MGDKSFLFSDSGLGFLMFATQGRTWAALGDPVGPPEEWLDLVWRFMELAESHGGRAAFYQIPASSLPLYVDAGLKILKLGEEARVLLPSFALRGSARADLRYALKRGERDRLQFEMVPRARVASIMDEIGASRMFGCASMPREERSAFRSPHSSAITCSRSRSRWCGRMVKRWHSNCDDD